MTPSISFHLDRLFSILAQHSIIYLNNLRSYYSYLANQYAVKNSKEFIRKFKKVFPWGSNSQLVSLDLSSLFTNVQLDFTIDVILRRIYRDKEIETNITSNELLLLCRKNTHFNGQRYLQKVSIAMRFPLGPVIAGIFMAELGRNLLPMLSCYMTRWKHYMMTLLPTLKQLSLSLFHGNISFTYKQEINGKMSLHDVLILRNSNNFEKTVHHKSICNDIYLYWESFEPDAWK